MATTKAFSWTEDAWHRLSRRNKSGDREQAPPIAENFLKVAFAGIKGARNKGELTWAELLRVHSSALLVPGAFLSARHSQAK